MPRSRAGRVVRCPECKCAMRVPQLTQSQLNMGRVIPCRAKLARRRKLDPEEAAHREREARETQEAQDQEAQMPGSESGHQPSVGNIDQAFEPRPPESAEDLKPEKTPTTSAEFDSEAVENEIAAPVIPPTPSKDLLDLLDTKVPEPPRPKRRNFVGRAAADSVASSGADNSGSTPSTPFINLGDPALEVEQEQDWEERLSTANRDRKLFARFFAICLVLVAVLNVIPAGLQWYHWAQLAESAPLPRWIYIQIFIGAIYLIYAVFLAQVPDWSALRAVSVAMLFTAFVFGIVSTGLLIGGHGDFSGYLGVPFALNRQACIWCVAMLCVATLMSFWGGKESAHWQRAEQILQGIIAKTV